MRDVCQVVWHVLLQLLEVISGLLHQGHLHDCLVNLIAVRARSCPARGVPSLHGCAFGWRPTRQVTRSSKSLLLLQLRLVLSLDLSLMLGCFVELECGLRTTPVTQVLLRVVLTYGGASCARELFESLVKFLSV